MKISKTTIVPIVSVVCLGISSITGHAISGQIQDEIATWALNLIGIGYGIYGVIKDHNIKKNELNSNNSQVNNQLNQEVKK